MNDEIYYDLKKFPLTQRETFDNTILLLTAVKSVYYYVVFFSAPLNLIEIAFDFESELHGKLTEYVSLDIGAHAQYILFESTLKNITADVYVEADGFTVESGNIIYRHKMKKDGVLPVSRETMNENIMKIKNDIIGYIENRYRQMLGK